MITGNPSPPMMIATDVTPMMTPSATNGDNPAESGSRPALLNADTERNTPSYMPSMTERS